MQWRKKNLCTRVIVPTNLNIMVQKMICVYFDKSSYIYVMPYGFNILLLHEKGSVDKVGKLFLFTCLHDLFKDVYH